MKWLSSWCIVFVVIFAGPLRGEEPAEDQAVESSESTFDSHIRLGYRDLAAGDAESAMLYFAKAAKEDAHDKRARVGLATALLQGERYADAENVLTDLVKEYPDDYMLKNNFAWLYATATDHAIRDGKKAVELAQEALLLAPTDHHVWSTLAEAYYISGNYEKALRAAEEALSRAMAEPVSGAVIAEYRVQLNRCKQASGALPVAE